jgi:hypothetical protein
MTRTAPLSNIRTSAGGRRLPFGHTHLGVFVQLRIEIGKFSMQMRNATKVAKFSAFEK